MCENQEDGTCIVGESKEDEPTAKEEKRDPHWFAKVCPNTGEKFEIISEQALGGLTFGRKGTVWKCSSCGEEIAFVGWIV